jgi:hypothetical protein
MENLENSTGIVILILKGEIRVHPVRAKAGGVIRQRLYCNESASGQEIWGTRLAPGKPVETYLTNMKQQIIHSVCSRDDTVLKFEGESWL